MYYNKPPENDIAVFTRIIKDEIKNEIINELRTNQKYDQILDVYQEETEIEPKQEGPQQEGSPYIKNTTGTLLEGTYATHHPNQIIRNRNGGLYGNGLTYLQGTREMGFCMESGQLHSWEYFCPILDKEF
ncbi:MAG: hypothetical protein ACOCG5_10555 [Candidatus Alkaliphilus sp. MAG34]